MGLHRVMDVFLDPIDLVTCVVLERLGGVDVPECNRHLHGENPPLSEGMVCQKSRRRFDELSIPLISRYLATVRRAMSMPCSLSSSTSFWSLWGCLGSSLAMISLILVFTASEAMSSPSVLLIDELKKNFSSKIPCGVCTYL